MAVPGRRTSLKEEDHEESNGVLCCFGKMKIGGGLILAIRTLSATVALCVVSGLLYIYVVCSSLELNYDWNGWPERAFIAC
ncbi:hypothetical protein MtrunA17_Chr3g0083391 [Medicago truncatula]|uniref:Transmembrane protein, putative n=1 Tax=Medicago truncatula TaxID=3880 RepID=G7IYU1_MEDTR|nr:transmembrane protein, putative [Medicago truncatula]RHN65753.1 hypothetical protein MtrunA17_Chr3g0083391 [Medicago truncatula]